MYKDIKGVKEYTYIRRQRRPGQWNLGHNASIKEIAGSGDSYIIVFLSCIVLLGSPHTVVGPVAAGPCGDFYFNFLSNFFPSSFFFLQYMLVYELLLTKNLENHKTNC